MSDLSYKTLINILDNIRSNAPNTEEFKIYHSKHTEDIIFSRSQALLHLFLLSKFGLEDFLKRDQLITDGKYDGGVDAYYLDEINKIIYFIQGKFKTDSSAFETTKLSATELLKMELVRITQGKNTDSNGNNFNEKINNLQCKFQEASKIAIYNSKVIILGNLYNINDEQLRRLTENIDYEIYDYERTYTELVSPVCSGTYFDPKKLLIEIDISDTTDPQIRQTISTSFGRVNISAYIVPTKEIGRILLEYKNAILKYNPRNYLGLANNPVNNQIKSSIINLKLEKFNDFALLNNGITVIADDRVYSDQTGSENIGKLQLINPQIINGGQTAYILSEIYQENKNNLSIFDKKDVFLKVIVPIPGEFQGNDGENKRIQLIEIVSNANNYQTPIDEADRKSNNIQLKKAQEIIFYKYGYFLETKRGEFYEGLKRNYINTDIIIDKVDMLRCIIAFREGKPNIARSLSRTRLFSNDFFSTTFIEPMNQNSDLFCSEITFAYRIRNHLFYLEQNDVKNNNYGYAFKYGKYAVIYAISLSLKNSEKAKLNYKKLNEMETKITKLSNQILNRWAQFEDEIQNKSTNEMYLNKAQGILDFDNYYKGKTLNEDIFSFFGNNK